MPGWASEILDACNRWVAERGRSAVIGQFGDRVDIVYPGVDLDNIGTCYNVIST